MINYPELYYGTFSEIVEKYTNIPLENLIQKWNEPHRKFHKLEHLNAVLAGLTLQQEDVKSEDDWDALVLAAFFHDSFYVPGDKQNEVKSVEIMNSFVLPENVKNNYRAPQIRKFLVD